ncbi:MAG: FHA domain-containing protein [Verrucomicrobiae bacterium]|nr:FHA domain-containing protein [Verrucomicrobiae bacterium]
MAQLVYQQPDGTKKILEASEAPLIIGRLEDSDILVSDPFISRVHCGIFYRQQRFHLKDLGSSNGTYRNGSRVFECVLVDGDRIQVGNTTLLFQITKAGALLLRQSPAHTDMVFPEIRTAPPQPPPA